jgi:uncharacterized membrane protein YsdA (DUF1294 family)
MKEYILCYLTGINALTVILCFIDKQASKNDDRRISEKTLMLLALAGGSLGLWLSMIMILQLFLIWFLLK